MDQNEMYVTQENMEDSSERLEKKEQLRAKVQALVSYYEDEKRRNEELTMELERLKAEQQMQGAPGSMGPIGGPAPGMPGMNGMNPQPFPARGPQQPPQGMPPFGQPGGFPQQQPFPGGPNMPSAPGMPGMPASAPDFPPQGASAQAPGGYTLQNFGAPSSPMGMPPQGMPPQHQNPYAPQSPQGMHSFGHPGGFQPPAPPSYGSQGFGGPQSMGYQNQGFGLNENIGTVLQTIAQVRAKLHQFESIRGYGYPPQPAYVDYDTVMLLDKLYDQLGDLSRELTQRR